MIENNDLLAKIEEWKDGIANNNNHIHFAFLEIFIEFEKFLTNSFLEYALGEEGKEHYKPTRRIEFYDKEHFEGLLKCNKPYIDYIKKIQEVKKFIFSEINCPFNKVFSSSEFISTFQKMQIIRNFIAHQSEESKNKYIKKVLEPSGVSTFIKVDTFLNKINRQKSISNYSIYIEVLRFHSEIICNPESEWVSKRQQNRVANKLPSGNLLAIFAVICNANIDILNKFEYNSKYKYSKELL